MIKLAAVGIVIEATERDFTVKSSVRLYNRACKRIGYQDTLYTPVKRADAAKFFAWLRVNRLGPARGLSIADLRILWSELGVAYDYH